MRPRFGLHQIARSALFTLACASLALAQGQAPVEPTVERANQHLRAQEWAQAAEVLSELSEREPDNPRHWLRLGYCRHQLGEIDQAIPCYEKALDGPQTRTPAMYNLACALALTGEGERAIELLATVAGEGGVSPGQIRSDSDFDSIKNDPRFIEIVSNLGGPAEGSPARQFDFWVGDWDVLGADGRRLGRNVITKRMNGWIIHEAWSGAGGSQGESINFYDVERGTWRQLWMSDSGGMTEYEGEWRDGAIRYDSGRHLTSSGTKTLQRSSFTPLEDGSVRQFIESSSDGGETWTAGFEGFYSRRESDLE